MFKVLGYVLTGFVAVKLGVFGAFNLCLFVYAFFTGLDVFLRLLSSNLSSRLIEVKLEKLYTNYGIVQGFLGIATLIGFVFVDTAFNFPMVVGMVGITLMFSCVNFDKALKTWWRFTKSNASKGKILDINTRIA